VSGRVRAAGVGGKVRGALSLSLELEARRPRGLVRPRLCVRSWVHPPDGGRQLSQDLRLSAELHEAVGLVGRRL
jgi:hypothetical protein